jgi:hypothetical protein
MRPGRDVSVVPGVTGVREEDHGEKMPPHRSKKYQLLACVLTAALCGSVAVAGHRVRNVRVLKPGEKLKKSKPAPAPAKKARASGKVSLRNPYSADAADPGKKHLMKTQSGTHLDPRQYGEIRDASFALMKQFPPDKYYYIGLGRSPASMIAFLQNLSTQKDPTDVAMNFPASGVRWAEPVSYQKNYYKYFDKLVPADVWTGKRKILLVDRVGVYGGSRRGNTPYYSSGQAGGNSIVKMLKVFRAYIKDRGHKVKVEGVGYVPHGLSYKFPNDLHHINTKDFPIVDAMGSSLHTRPGYSQFGNEGQSFDEIAEHPENHIHESPLSRLRVREAYGKYQRRMFKRMVADKKVDSFLNKTLGHLLQ